MIETIKVSSRGQVVIPEGFRKSLKIKEGSKLVMIKKDNKMILELEADFLKEMSKNDSHEDEERKFWMKISEKSMEKVWNNKKDDQYWSKYL